MNRSLRHSGDQPSAKCPHANNVNTISSKKYVVFIPFCSKLYVIYGEQKVWPGWQESDGKFGGDKSVKLIDKFAIHPEGGWEKGLSAWNVSPINQHISCDVLMVYRLQNQRRSRSINMTKCSHPAEVKKTTKKTVYHWNNPLGTKMGVVFIQAVLMERKH